MASPTTPAESATPNLTNPPTTVDDVIGRLRDIDARLSPDDGVAVFNRMYLTVTEHVSALIAPAGAAAGPAPDPQALADLDVRFASWWLAAVEADDAGQPIPTAWQPLFEARHGGCEPVQYAVAGMNTHIEHDLPLAVVDTCSARSVDPDVMEPDYQVINGLLAQVEAPIRRSFLDHAERQVDNRIGPVVHVLSAWSIDTAREVAWVTAGTIWSLRDVSMLRNGFVDALARTVAMTSRALLVPTT